MRGIPNAFLIAVLAAIVAAPARADEAGKVEAAAAVALAAIFAGADSVTTASVPADTASAPLAVHTAWREGAVVGRALVVDEMGKHGPITMLVAVDAAGAVRDVAVLASREKRGKAVGRARFLQQFEGKRSGDPLRLGREIDGVTGATYSSRALVRGVDRALDMLAGVAAKAGG